jgi:hypothetical protein
MEQLNEVHNGYPDPSEMRIVKVMKAVVRRTIKDRW